MKKDNKKEIINLVNETLISANNYIDNAIPIIKELAELFYQQPDDKAWGQLTDLFEGIQWILQTLGHIDSINDLDTIVNDYKIWNEYVQVVAQLIDIVPEIENAILNRDNILIGDMLLYEIVPIFENMLTKLEFLKPEVVDEDVN